jgi:hypothetical protein
MSKSYIYDGGTFMDDYLTEIRNTVTQFKTFGNEEDMLKAQLAKINNDLLKLESSYNRITNKFQKNSNILEELDNVIAILNDIKDKIMGYNEFRKNKKKTRFLQTTIVMGICSILISPLIVIDATSYMEIMLLGITIMGFSNAVKYFNDIKERNELIKTNDIDKIISDINKKERQKEIAQCMEIKLGVKKVALSNEMNSHSKRKEDIINRLKCLNDNKVELIGKLSKEFDDVSMDIFNQNTTHVKLK